MAKYGEKVDLNYKNNIIYHMMVKEGCVKATNYLLLILFIIFNANIVHSKVVKIVNPDGSVTYTNSYSPKERIRTDSSQEKNVYVKDNVKFYNISAKKLKESDRYVYVGIKIKVENLSNDQDVRVRVEAIDENGFQVEETSVRGIVPPGRIGYITDRVLIEKNLYRTIKEWRFK